MKGRIGLVGVALVLGCSGCSQPQPSPAASPAPKASSVTAAGSRAGTPGATRANLTARAPGAFYEPPADVPKRPGTLLRSESLGDVTLPPDIQGFRILYTTTVNDQIAATAVATVFAPAHPPAGPRPVVTWEHGTTGVLQKCMPSLVSAPSEGIPGRDEIAAAGWVIVATDYSFAEKGGAHPYLIGEGEARAALDAFRAARQMRELELGSATVVWGHSQGGHAALWTGIVGPRYAPEVELLGVAAIAPAANIADILARNVAVDKRLGAYIALAYSRFYPDITFEQAVRPEALAAAREMTNLCGFVPAEDPRRIAALSATFEGPALATKTNPALKARLDENSAAAPIAAPVLIAQGLADAVVLPAASDAYFAERCGAGQTLEYWSYTGFDHGTIVRPGTPLAQPLVAWTAARFARQRPSSECKHQSY